MFCYQVEKCSHNSTKAHRETNDNNNDGVDDSRNPLAVEIFNQEDQSSISKDSEAIKEACNHDTA